MIEGHEVIATIADHEMIADHEVIAGREAMAIDPLQTEVRGRSVRVAPVHRRRSSPAQSDSVRVAPTATLCLSPSTLSTAP